MNKIILYSTHCPLCKGLAKALDIKGIPYELCTDINIMQKLGITHAPMLSIDGELLSNQMALKWVLKQEKKC